MSNVIIDRRLNQKGRNLGNRQRFIERVKGAVRDSAKRAIKDKSIRGSGDTSVTVPTDGIAEPRFSHDMSSGSHDFVLPGNRAYSKGDLIPKPTGAGGQGGGDGAGDDGEFEFSLSQDEFQALVLDDLDLPDMVKKSERHSKAATSQRAGFASDGNPANLDVERSAISGLMRRVALRAGRRARANDLEEAALAGSDEEARAGMLEEAARLRDSQPPFLDDVDLRYRRREQVKNPASRAVMVCVMDVSGSMGDHERTVAKRFFMLLALFLRRRYGDVDIVFVRHHHSAEEVDEDTFFGTGSMGGTVVSAAYKKVEDIVRARYGAADWNIYIAQASDGDNGHGDDAECRASLARLLPSTQYFAYLEIERDESPGLFRENAPGLSTLWSTLDSVRALFAQMSMCRASSPEQVVPVFRSLFRKKQGTA